MSNFTNLNFIPISQGQTKGKAATRGQKQIFKENAETIQLYRYISYGFSVIFEVFLKKIIF